MLAKVSIFLKASKIALLQVVNILLFRLSHVDKVKDYGGRVKNKYSTCILSIYKVKWPKVFKVSIEQ
jgi:hypothetical protein